MFCISALDPDNVSLLVWGKAKVKMVRMNVRNAMKSPVFIFILLFPTGIAMPSERLISLMTCESVII